VRVSLNEPTDRDSLMFSEIEFQTVRSVNIRALQPVDIATVRGTCNTLSKKNPDTSGRKR